MSMGRVSSNGVKERIGQLCSEFKLPTVGAEAGPRFTAAGHTDALVTLVEVLEQEAEDCRQRRIVRIRRASRLPVGKTWDTFEHDRVPVTLRQQLDELADGSFVERGVNVLAFGLPGTGKTHAMCAIGHRLVESGRSVLFTPAYRLVQDMLAAKRDLDLPRMLRKLDNIDFLLIDDLGYRGVTASGRPVRLSATECKLLFELSISAGRVLTRDQILQRVWGADYSGEGKLLRATVKNLRRKLGDKATNPRYIFTEPRVGYRMAKP